MLTLNIKLEYLAAFTGEEKKKRMLNYFLQNNRRRGKSVF